MHPEFLQRSGTRSAPAPRNTVRFSCVAKGLKIHLNLIMRPSDGALKSISPIKPMPEASVHKDACPVLRQHDVRRSRQPPHIHPEPESLSMQPSAHLQLRGRVLSSDSGHVDVAGEGSEGHGGYSCLLSFEYSAF